MKNNDLSNRSAMTIGVRVEDFLIKTETDGIKNKFLNFIYGKDKRLLFDQRVLNFVNYIFRHTDMTVDLVIDRRNLKRPYLMEKLDLLPFNRILPIIKPVEIAILLNCGDLSYYVDSNEERMSIVSHKYCTTLEEIEPLIRRGE